MDQNVFEMTENKFSHFGQNVWKYKLNSNQPESPLSETNG